MTTLRDARLRALLSMRQLARQAGLLATTVYLLENGKRSPQLLTIHKLSRALGINPHEIAEFRRVMEMPSGKDHLGKEKP